jgi:hypothetical protein
MACHHVFALHDAKEKWQGALFAEEQTAPIDDAQVILLWLILV